MKTVRYSILKLIVFVACIIGGTGFNQLSHVAGQTAIESFVEGRKYKTRTPACRSSTATFRR